MDGIHDLGGLDGFGSIDHRSSEPVFASEWEAKAWGLTMGSFAMGLSNGSQFRSSIERMDPVHYLTSRYYEHWVTSLATRLVETGRVTAEELDQRAGGPVPLSRPPAAAATMAPDAHRAQVFEPGDQVRVRTVQTRAHTRCPRYVRAKRGTVVRVDPPSTLPDVENDAARRMEPVYAVRFEADELWGPGADGSAVHVDLWASYLEAA